jgi:hypothetical protein
METRFELGLAPKSAEKAYSPATSRAANSVEMVKYCVVARATLAVPEPGRLEWPVHRETVVEDAGGHRIRSTYLG